MVSCLFFFSYFFFKHTALWSWRCLRWHYSLQYITISHSQYHKSSENRAQQAHWWVCVSLRNINHGSVSEVFHSNKITSSSPISDSCCVGRENIKGYLGWKEIIKRCELHQLKLINQWEVVHERGGSEAWDYLEKVSMQKEKLIDVIAVIIIVTISWYLQATIS